MLTWLAALTELPPQAFPAVLVGVAATQGSVPREAGAAMLVTRDACFDTIGGGHLELQAILHARDMLAASAQQSVQANTLRRFALGPSLGQCCGGAVELSFELLTEADIPAFLTLADAHCSGQDSWVVSAIPCTESNRSRLHRTHPAMQADNGPSRNENPACASMNRIVLIQQKNAPSIVYGNRTALPFALNASASSGPQCALYEAPDGALWLARFIPVPRNLLVLFGAGHVGAAIVRAMADLPCQIIWIDERNDVFPSALPANVRTETSDAPEEWVERAPPHASFLVMTHSHARDQQLSEAILRRNHHRWFGLIGSHTKRMQFEHRLRQRGMSDEQISTMICPIGLPGIDSKAPAVIAASVAAQLLQVWEAQAHALATDDANSVTIHAWRQSHRTPHS